ncbi:MAG: hypothetical protein AB7S26_02710 [Sandaracinaceae bacterium]
MTRDETTVHLDEVSLEALAGGREDLVAEAMLLHLDECAECAERVELERSSVADASMALRRATPELDDLDAMIARAMEAAEPEDAPSRRSLWMGAGFGLVAAIGLGLLSIPWSASVDGVGATGRQLLTLGRALDRVVESSLPGGWMGVAIVGLALALALALPARWLLGGRRTIPPIVTGALGVALFAMVGMTTARAYAYRVEGAWPEPIPRVTVDAERAPISGALRQASESAGLGIVVRLDDDPPVTLHVQDAPMDQVFEAILGDMDVVVRPGASVVSVRADEGAPSASVVPIDDQDADQGLAEPPAQVTGDDRVGVYAVVHDGSDDADDTPPPPADGRVPPVPPVPAVPAVLPIALATAHEEQAGVRDRVTFGGDVEIGTNDVVRGVYTMGGDAEIRGRALGDVVTMGGDADIRGEVVGNVTTMGGDIEVRDGARIHGDLNAMGGDIDIADGAQVYGQVLLNPGEAMDGDEVAPAATVHQDGDGLAGVFRWGLFNALIFLFGLFMLGTARKRFGTLRTEIGERPVRSALGGMFGALAAMALTVVLCLTLIGIPGAVVLSILLVVAVFVGWTTSAWWLGSALPLRRLKDRPVAQLAAGVGVFFVVGLVPKIGVLVVIAAVLAGLGAVIATEFGARKQKTSTATLTGPYRD